jgi:hypothetical protein
MSIAAEHAVREWVNGLTALVGPGNPLSRGAFTIEQRSPADGAYATVTRTSEGVTRIVAEPGGPSIARMQFLVYAGTLTAAEQAAKALRAEVELLSGCPVRCGDTGVTILVADNYVGPFSIPHVGDTGEQFCYQVNADFMLAE